MNNVRVVIAGSLAAIVMILINISIQKPLSLQFLAVLLGVIVGIYFGFGIHDGRTREIIIESVNGCLIIVLIFMGLLVSHYFLAAGYFVHGIWDLVHRPGLVQTRVPEWYTYLCSIFDWILGAFIIVWWI